MYEGRKPVAAPDVRIHFTHTVVSLALRPRRAAELLSAEAPSSKCSTKQADQEQVDQEDQDQGDQEQVGQ